MNILLEQVILKNMVDAQRRCVREPEGFLDFNRIGLTIKKGMAMFKKTDIIERILNSDELKKHQPESNLLKYIVDASLKGETPDQTSIAIQALGRDKSFDPNEDSIVRVRIHNLRKLLETYYLSEGSHDKVRVEIPPGSYVVKFVSQKPSRQIFRMWYYGVSIFLISILALLNIYQWQLDSSDPGIASLLHKVNSTPMWNDFLISDLPTLFVLGDNYFFQEIPHDTMEPYRTIRYNHINSTDDLSAFMRYQDQALWHIKPNDITLYENEILLAVHELYPLFYYYHKEFEIISSSNLKPEDLQKYNIVYLGTTKNLRSIASLLINLNIQFQVSNFSHRFIIKNVGSDSIQTFYSIGNDEFGRRMDYVILDKLPGPNSNFIFIITSTDLTGVYEMIKLTVDPSKNSHFEESVEAQAHNMPTYFESLWQVSSLQRSGFKTKLLRLISVPPDIELIRP